MLLLVMVANPMQAQNSNIKKADAFYESMEYSKAIEFYKKALKKSKKNSDATANIADCYRRTSNYSKAAYWYEKAIKLDEDNAALKYYYGEALMSNKEYDKAQWSFQEYARLEPNDSRATRYLEWCQNIDLYLQDSSKYNLEVADFNSPESDFGPSFYNQGVVFASARPTSSIDRQDGWTGESYLDLFIAEQMGSNWADAKEIPGKSKSKFHEGPACFSQDDTKMYFTRNVVGKGTKGKIAILKIFESRLRNNEWIDPQELSFNSKNNTFSVGHPTISQDDKTLYFTSDMQGGYGGKDIYIVEKRNGSWGKPTNLGPTINTEGDEMFPFIHEDGTLYFASNGHGGFGGLDLYASQNHDDDWSKSENMGYPINSPQDDFGLILTEDKQKGFLATNRKGGKGNDDIYIVSIAEDKALELINQPVASIEKATPGKVSYATTSNTKSSSTSMPMNSSSLSFYDDVTVTSVKTADGEEDKFFLVGILLDYNTKAKIPYAKVFLEEIDEVGQQYIAEDQTDRIGNFYFELKPNKSYVVYKQNEDGIIDDIREFNTKGREESQILHAILEANRPINLRIEAQNRYNELHGEPAISPDKGFAGKDFLPEAAPKTGKDFSQPEELEEEPAPKTAPKLIPERPIDNTNPTYIETEEVIESTTTYSETINYKVQIGSFQKSLYNSHPFLRNVQGEYSTEKSPSGLNRYLVGSYDNLSQAASYQEYLKDQGYRDAVIVIYVNGIRLEKGIDQIDEKYKIW